MQPSRMPQVCRSEKVKSTLRASQCLLCQSAARALAHLQDRELATIFCE
jgi:hypothetical protein